MENLNIELSFNSVVGLTNPRMMKVKGKIKGEDVVVLINCRTTHKFIDAKLVHSLNMPTKTTSNYGVILGSSIVVQGKGIFRKVEVMVGDWNISDSFPTLELGGVDMILGMQ